MKSHSEETKIRSILESLKVNGISRGDNGYKVQLGGLILKPGRLLPRIIEGQSDDLMVKNISPTNIEITWVGDEEADKPRVMLISVDLDPKVGVVLPLNAKNNESAGSRLVYIKKKERAKKMTIKGHHNYLFHLKGVPRFFFDGDYDHLNYRGMSYYRRFD